MAGRKRSRKEADADIETQDDNNNKRRKLNHNGNANETDHMEQDEENEFNFAYADHQIDQSWLYKPSPKKFKKRTSKRSKIYKRCKISKRARRSIRSKISAKSKQVTISCRALGAIECATTLKYRNLDFICGISWPNMQQNKPQNAIKKYDTLTERWDDMY